MTFSAKVDNTATLHVLIRQRMFAVIRGSHKTTKLQTRALELNAKANIECHIRIVSVYVKTEVLSLAIAHDKTMVPVPNAPRARKEQMAKRLESLLQTIDPRLEPNFVQN